MGDFFNILQGFVKESYPMVFITVAFIVIASGKNNFQIPAKRYTFIAIMLTFLLELLSYMESYFSNDPDMRLWRLILSFVCYVIRPLCILMLILGIKGNYRFTWLLWVPQIIVTVVFATCFFSPIAFSFSDDTYSFHRGPWFFVIYVVTVIYFLLFFKFINMQFRLGFRREGTILVVCEFGVIGGVLVDIMLDGDVGTISILTACVFYYVFLNSQYSERDTLTGLFSREMCIRDLDTNRNEVIAVASIDMNGLKKLNDTEGHFAGDRALAAIGKCIYAQLGRYVQGYRVGGDEFLIAFRKGDEESVKKTLDEVKRKTTEANVSVSIGYAVRTAKENAMDLWKLSDAKMYENKNEFYRLSGNNRRTT